MQISALVSLLPLLVALTSAAPYPVTGGDIVARAKGSADAGSSSEAGSGSDATTSTPGGTSSAGGEGAHKHPRKDKCIIEEKAGEIKFMVLSETTDFYTKVEALSSKGITVTHHKSGNKKHGGSQSAGTQQESAPAKRAAGGEGGQAEGQTPGQGEAKPHKKHNHKHYKYNVQGTIKAESDVAALSEATSLDCKKHDGKGKGEGKGHGGESSTSNSAGSEDTSSGKPQHGGSQTAGKETQ